MSGANALRDVFAPALGPQAARWAFAAAIAPIVLRAPFAEIAGMHVLPDQVDQPSSAELMREPPGRGSRATMRCEPAHFLFPLLAVSRTTLILL